MFFFKSWLSSYGDGGSTVAIRFSSRLQFVEATEQLGVYAADVIPSVGPGLWWLIFWAGLVAEGLLKFVLIGEIFAHIFDRYPSLANIGKLLIRTVGASLVLAAALAAAYAPKDGLFGIVSGAHLLQQTIYLIEAGLLAFIFALSSYFRLALDRPLFGIALGLSISACVHLATWAIIANGGWANSTRTLLDFVNMATYHVCVLIWYYYLLVPEKKPAGPKLPPSNLPSGFGPDDLDLLNQQLEQLIRP